MKAFENARRHGKYFEVTKSAIKAIASRSDWSQRFRKGTSEKLFEGIAHGALAASPDIPALGSRIGAVGSKEAINIQYVNVFGLKHNPDLSVGTCKSDTYVTAVEIKLITSGSSMREMIGQGVCYRTKYKFAVLVAVFGAVKEGKDTSSLFEKITDTGSVEYGLFSSLAAQNIFSVMINANTGETFVVEKGDLGL